MNIFILRWGIIGAHWCWAGTGFDHCSDGCTSPSCPPSIADFGQASIHPCQSCTKNWNFKYSILYAPTMGCCCSHRLSSLSLWTLNEPLDFSATGSSSIRNSQSHKNTRSLLLNSLSYDSLWFPITILFFHSFPNLVIMLLYLL